MSTCWKLSKQLSNAQIIKIEETLQQKELYAFCNVPKI